MKRPTFTRKKKLVKLSVNLPEESVEYLWAYAIIHDITMTEAFRRALGLQSFIHKEVAKGTIVYFERQDGSCDRLVSTALGGIR